MKILFLANHFNTGGITTYILTLTKGFVKKGHQVLIASSGGDREEDALRHGARHITLPALRVKCECHPGLLQVSMAIARLVKEEGVDILHPQTRVTQAVAAFSGLFSKRPYVSTGHGFFKAKLSRQFFPLWGHSVIAVSYPVARHLTEDLGVPFEDVIVIPNGIDGMEFQPATEEKRKALRHHFGLSEEVPLIGIIARLSDVKGHGYLIEAMHELCHRLPGVKCLVFGDGPLEAELKAHVARLKLEGAVLFFKMNGRPAEILPMFDVFAMPSLQEGLGLSAMEAEACGIPVVASRVGGLVEAIKDGVTGLLVPSKDHLALADALAKVLTDRDLAMRLGRNGRERVLVQFSFEAMIERTLDVYTDALK